MYPEDELDSATSGRMPTRVYKKGPCLMRSFLKPFIIITISHYALGWLAALLALIEWDQPGIGYVLFRLIMFPYWSAQDFPEYWPICSVFNSMLWASLGIGVYRTAWIIRNNDNSKFLSRKPAILLLIGLILCPFLISASIIATSRILASAPFDRTNATLIKVNELKTLVEDAKHYRINYRASDNDYHYFHRVELMGGSSYRIKREDLSIEYEFNIEDEPDEHLPSTGVYPHWFGGKSNAK